LPPPAPTPIPVQSSPPLSLPAPASEVAPTAPTPAPPIVTAPPPPATPAFPATATSVEQTVQASTAPQPTNPGLGLPIGGIACGVAGLASVGTAIYYYNRARTLSDRVSTRRHPRPLTIRLAGTPRPCSGCSTASEPECSQPALCSTCSVGRLPTRVTS
jgi:hypothetical protein